MKLTIMGIEYNQLLSGKVLAEMGNEVTYISKDNKRIENIKRGYYNADEAMIIQNINVQNSIEFTTDIKEALQNSNMWFISEGYTDENQEGIELILKHAREVGANMSKHLFIVDRSEISSQRIDFIKEAIQDELRKRNVNFSFEIISNPGFLRA